jgi:hypothetical protein
VTRSWRRGKRAFELPASATSAGAGLGFELQELPDERLPLTLTATLLRGPLLAASQVVKMGVKGLWTLLNPVARPIKCVQATCQSASRAIRHIAE